MFCRAYGTSVLEEMSTRLKCIKTIYPIDCGELRSGCKCLLAQFVLICGFVISFAISNPRSRSSVTCPCLAWALQAQRLSRNGPCGTDQTLGIAL